MSKFKAGDRVYCPIFGGSITELYQSNTDDNELYVDDPNVPLGQALGYVIDQNGYGSKGLMVFHVTHENKQALETLYGFEFETV